MVVFLHLAVVDTFTFFYPQILIGLIKLHVPHYCLVIWNDDDDVVVIILVYLLTCDMGSSESIVRLWPGWPGNLGLITSKGWRFLSLSLSRLAYEATQLPTQWVKQPWINTNQSPCLVKRIKKQWSYASKTRPKLTVGSSANPVPFPFYSCGAVAQCRPQPLHSWGF